jgi:hypothetical protein
MTIDTDFEVQANGDIRHVANNDHYTVIELHRWLGGLMDDAAASGDDILDITDSTASERSTDNIVTLKAPFNIDDTTAQFLYDGSIIQDNGDTIYDGLVIIAAAGMYLDIIQNGTLATNFWTTGYNDDSANGISHRFMLKVRTAGADIDGRRLIGTTREFGFTYSEFKINGTARGNNVMALTYATDLNNQTAEATVAGWTTITNIEGYRAIDVTGDGVDEFYFSEWDKDSFTINQFYERMKWLTRRGSSSTVYEMNGDLFRGITHQITLTDQGAADWDAVETVTWPGGTGKMLAVDDINASTKMWIQLITGVAPTNTQLITGSTSGASANASGTATERSLSFPWAGASTGTSIIGAYGFGIEAADLTASDKLFDLDNTQRIPPNNVTFTVAGLVNGEDRVLVTNLGYDIAYTTEVGGPFTDNETVNFSGGGTARLGVLVDNGTSGRMNIRMLTGSVPVATETITGVSSSATAVVGSISPGIDTEQLLNNALLDGAAVTEVVCTSAIPTDTPSDGTIRILRANGVYSNHSYSSYTGSTFTITSHDFSSNNAEANAGIFISYIDLLAAGLTASFTSVYLADRSLFIRIRDGGGTPIKTFETTGTLGSAGGSSTAIRTSDT